MDLTAVGKQLLRGCKDGNGADEARVKVLSDKEKAGTEAPACGSVLLALL